MSAFEYAFVIERASSPVEQPDYWTGPDVPVWSDDPYWAVRFCRPRDAVDAYGPSTACPIRVCEHGFDVGLRSKEGCSGQTRPEQLKGADE